MIKDPLPTRLLKFFDKLEHAEDFVLRGRIRLGSIASYAGTQDSTRVDDSEGQGHLKVLSPAVPQLAVDTQTVSYKPGAFDYWRSGANPAFLFCMACPDANIKNLSSRWPYVVEIFDPEEFKHDFLECVAHSAPAGHKILFFDTVKVVYNKGEVTTEPTEDEEARLHYAQKPLRFHEEREFRFVIELDVIEQMTQADHISIQLGRHHRYAKIGPTGIA